MKKLRITETNLNNNSFDSSLPQHSEVCTYILVGMIISWWECLICSQDKNRLKEEPNLGLMLTNISDSYNVNNYSIYFEFLTQYDWFIFYE